MAVDLVGGTTICLLVVVLLALSLTVLRVGTKLCTKCGKRGTGDYCGNCGSKHPVREKGIKKFVEDMVSAFFEVLDWWR